MRHIEKLLTGFTLAGALLAAGCLAAAAGAGAAGGVYVTNRGAEAQVASSVATTLDAARRTFQEMSVTETKSSNEQDGSVEKRSLEGKTGDREIEVDLKSEGSGTHVEVVAKKTAVTWDKDLAKKILNRIVELAK
jgi:uncharacterized protein DUF3568